MIALGLDMTTKAARVREYVASHDVKKVYVLHPAQHPLDCGIPGVEAIEWSEIIMYRTFYRLLQEIDARSLVVINECLRTQNRHDLTYNCIRHYLAQAGHVLVFQWLPCIDDMQDFMTLFDFDTRSRWKRERWDPDLVRENAVVEVTPRAPIFRTLPVDVDARTRAAYEAEKRKLFDTLGDRDPHTIPRNLYLISGKSKLAATAPGRAYVGRNNRFKLENLRTFGEAAYGEAPYTVFELPHRFIEFADFSTISGQTEAEVLVADLPVDAFYVNRYAEWAGRIADGYGRLS